MTLADASWKVTAKIAQAERDSLRAQLAEVAERPVCDCHTWPTVKEMHDYCEALERKLAEAREYIVKLASLAAHEEPPKA
jgi:hypothetical protein